MEDDDVFDKPQKKVGFADGSQSGGKDPSERYFYVEQTHNYDFL